MSAKKKIFALAFTMPCGALVVAQGCADFSSGQCTDKALCDTSEAGATDVTVGDAIIDVSVDTLVRPDGDVPDGECNGGAEDCANGKDDNCNGLVDCADPVCQNAGYVCAAPPQGWSGPVALESVSGGTLPSCGGSYATSVQQGHDGASGSPATCGCSCSGPTNVQCNGVDVSYYTDNGCGALYGSASLPAVNFCVSTGDTSVIATEGVAQPTAFNGNCTGVPSTSPPPAVTYANSYAACSYDGPSDTGGCTSGAQCVQSPSNGKTCVYQTGDVACPPATYTSKTLFYATIDDTRGCSTCTCTATAGTCTGTINVYNVAGCGGSPIATISTNSACTATSSAKSAVATSLTTNPGTCGNNGTGGPTGSVTSTSPVTVCCTP